MRLLPDPLRFAFGTLTILPVKPPAHIDRKVAGWAMTAAPLVGLALGALVGVPLWVLDRYDLGTPLLLAVLAIGALAWLTRAMHLDGLADVADGLGSGKRGEEALAIMKKSDIGPFGVATLVILLLLQVTALAACLDAGYGVLALGVALVWSRLSITLLIRGHAAARPDGLGAVVARSVTMPMSLVALALSCLTVACTAVLSRELGAFADRYAGIVEQTFIIVLLLLANVPLSAIAAHAVRRFGGITGDVYGAAAEMTFTAVLIILALGA